MEEQQKEDEFIYRLDRRSGIRKIMNIEHSTERTTAGTRKDKGKVVHQGKEQRKEEPELERREVIFSFFGHQNPGSALTKKAGTGSALKPNQCGFTH
jgi:hypothetical protein